MLSLAVNGMHELQAVLLVGFLQLEVEHFRSFMLEMDADMVRLICCNRAMLRNTMQDALEVAAVPEYEAVSALGWPGIPAALLFVRVCLTEARIACVRYLPHCLSLYLSD